LKRIIWDAFKLVVIFICCTFLFYFGLKAMHAEYEQYHRYDPPDGPAVKVFSDENSFIDRVYLFLRLGE